MAFGTYSSTTRDNFPDKPNRTTTMMPIETEETPETDTMPPEPETTTAEDEEETTEAETTTQAPTTEPAGTTTPASVDELDEVVDWVTTTTEAGPTAPDDRMLVHAFTQYPSGTHNNNNGTSNSGNSSSSGGGGGGSGGGNSTTHANNNNNNSSSLNPHSNNNGTSSSSNSTHSSSSSSYPHPHPNPHPNSLTGIEKELYKRRQLAHSLDDNRDSSSAHVNMNIDLRSYTCLAHRKHLSYNVAPCRFPFRYRGVEYWGCIHVDDTQLWCPTALDSNGNYVAGEWGYCSSSCPIELPACRTVDGPVKHAICKFPFTYEGFVHYQCTHLNDYRKWCATETDEHGHLLTGRWGYCQCDGKEDTTTQASTTTDGFPTGGNTMGGGGNTTTTVGNMTTVNATTPASNVTTPVTQAPTTTPGPTHIPLSFGMMPQEDDGVAVYIPSNYDDPVLMVVEREGHPIYRPPAEFYK